MAFSAFLYIHLENAKKQNAKTSKTWNIVFSLRVMWLALDVQYIYAKDKKQQAVECACWNLDINIVPQELRKNIVNETLINLNQLKVSEP